MIRMQFPAIVFMVASFMVASSELTVRLDAAEQSAQPETLAPLKDGVAPQTHEAMWAGFDPRAEPLEVEVLKEWEEEGVVLRVVRFRIGVFKNTKAMLAAVYGFPKGETELPGLVQIHGGGQYADYKACLANAKRGYATVSIAWAGRISAPDYRVSPAEVQLFWDGKTDDPNYRLTTDWGAVDGYHAPGRNAGNQFPSAKAAPWTLDAVESPRNSGWFLCTLAARRALTFLEQQAEVDANRLGVYGHSMGGKLTVSVAGADRRVKAAAPSCGGISDRYNDSAIFRATLGDDVSLERIACPIIFLSPANDFHGRLGDLPSAVHEIASRGWCVTCSPHHNHQDTPPYEVATLLWFDQHLKETFTFPNTPETSLVLRTDDGVPTFTVHPDQMKPVVGVRVFYTQHGVETQPEDSENAKHRFWHHADAIQADGMWTAKLPLGSTDKPLWVYANVSYPLDESVSGVGYYYRDYTAETFNLSSVVTRATAADLGAAGVRSMLKPTLVIESFEGDWEAEWFTYRPEQWGRSTHKLNDQRWKAPPDARLMLDVQSAKPNKIVVRLDDFVTERQLAGGDQWETLVLNPTDFHDHSGGSLADWISVRSLTISPSERLRPGRGESGDSRLFGGNWQGGPPRFRNLRWLPADDAPDQLPVESIDVQSNSEGDKTSEPAYPEFTWDRIPLYMHVRKAKSFTAKEIKFLSKFPLITFEKATGHEDHGSVEAGTLIAARAVKEINPTATILYYRNVIVHYDGYEANKGLEDIPGAMLHDDRGNTKLVRNRVSAYDLSNSQLRNWWLDSCKTMTPMHRSMASSWTATSRRSSRDSYADRSERIRKNRRWTATTC